MIGIDMDMPRNCINCPLEYWSGESAVCAPLKRRIFANRSISRLPNCPLHSFDDDEIRVGDEVITNYGSRAVVLGIDSYADSLFTVCSDGSCGTHDAKHFTKTGRHFDEVEILLKKMRGKDDD